jgi:hypothetical protein
MWKKISTAISILCMAVYVVAVVITAYKIVNAVAEHRIISEHEFAGLQDIVRGAGVLGFTGTELESEIRASVLRSLALEAIIVTGSDGTAFAVEKPGVRAVIPNYNNSAYSFNTKWKFYRSPHFAAITVDNRITLNLNALTGYIDKGRLGDILRETLLVIILSVTAAFLVLMLDIIVFDGQKTAYKTSKDPYRPISDENNKPSEPPITIPDEVEAPQKPSKPVPDKEPMVQEPDKPVFDEEAGVPSGMYLGLIQKLHEELAVDNGKYSDFVLLCAAWEWAANNFAETPVAKQIAEEAAVFFTVDRISAFKRGESSVFILLPGVTFKNGLKAAREFHGRILDNSTFKTSITDFYIGLTSRAGRQVEPERLILEVEKAVEKAKEDVTQPIVAFKADPSKYKDYIKNKK